jgi:hypothetical protein
MGEIWLCIALELSFFMIPSCIFWKDGSSTRVSSPGEGIPPFLYFHHLSTEVAVQYGC